MVHVAEVSINCDMYSLICYVTRKWPLAHAHLCVILSGPSFHVIELCFCVPGQIENRCNC